MIFETGLSTLNISRAKRAPNTINFVDMRLVLVFLATFLQSLFNLFNVQNLIGLYALCNIRQRQMLALAALNRRRRMQRRRNRRFRFWCLPRPRQSWFEIHYNAKGWKQAIPILRIIRWIVRICKLVWVEIRHKDQINVCRENRWLKFWTDSCS